MCSIRLICQIFIDKMTQGLNIAYLYMSVNIRNLTFKTIICSMLKDIIINNPTSFLLLTHNELYID